VRSPSSVAYHPAILSKMFSLRFQTLSFYQLEEEVYRPFSGLPAGCWRRYDNHLMV